MKKHKFNKALNDCGTSLLEMADSTWRKADGLDTAVRDEIAEGIARIVRAGYDCLASNIPYHTIDSWMAYIDHATAEWFRIRGFAEWFCIAAAQGFNSSLPLDLEQGAINFARSMPKRKRKALRTKTIDL
jgi:ribosomal protein L32E